MLGLSTIIAVIILSGNRPTPYGEITFIKHLVNALPPEEVAIVRPLTGKLRLNNVGDFLILHDFGGNRPTPYGEITLTFLVPATTGFPGIFAAGNPLLLRQNNLWTENMAKSAYLSYAARI